MSIDNDDDDDGDDGDDGDDVGINYKNYIYLFTSVTTSNRIRIHICATAPQLACYTLPLTRAAAEELQCGMLFNKATPPSPSFCATMAPAECRQF